MNREGRPRYQAITSDHQPRVMIIRRPAGSPARAGSPRARRRRGRRRGRRPGRSPAAAAPLPPSSATPARSSPTASTLPLKSSDTLTTTAALPSTTLTTAATPVFMAWLPPIRRDAAEGERLGDVAAGDLGDAVEGGGCSNPPSQQRADAGRAGDYSFSPSSSPSPRPPSLTRRPGKADKSSERRLA